MGHFIPALKLGAIPAVSGSHLPRNTVIHGDCIDVMARFPADSVDFILTDRQYLCRYCDQSGARSPTTIIRIVSNRRLPGCTAC